MVEEMPELPSIPVVEFSVGAVHDGAKFKCEMFKSGTIESKKRKLVCESPHIKYVGTNCHYDPSRNFLKHFVALVNKKTGEKKFFQADMFKLNPSLERETEKDSDEERQEAMKKVKNEERSFIERQDSLTEVFGSNKRQKAMASRQRNKVSDSVDAVKEAVVGVIENEGIAAGQSAGEQSLSFLPYNKEATSEEQVYDMETYIPLSLRTAVENAAQELLDPSASLVNKWKEAKDPRGSRYISWHATHPHPSVKNDPDTHLEYAKCLQILAYYVKIYAPSGNNAEKEAYIKEMSLPSREMLKNLFLPEEKSFNLKKKLSARVKDKVLAYAVILAWHIDSCQIDVQMFAEAFSLSERKISTVIKALGGTTKVSITGGLRRSLGVLKLPLVFPKIGKRGR